MTDIYELQSKAFRKVSAFAIIKDGVHVANVNLKFPEDGASRLYAYIHILGLEMVRDFAGGYGYDKRSAAITHAAMKIAPYVPFNGESVTNSMKEYKTKLDNQLYTFQSALRDIGGKDWNDALRDAGYIVLSVV